MDPPRQATPPGRQSLSATDAALAQIPSGLFVLTAAHDASRSGVLVDWVQRCSTTPPMVVVGMQKGLAVEPLIRDSRRFALCQIGEEDRYLRRKFASTPRPNEDPFIAIVTTVSPYGSPIIERAIAYLDCELVRRVDLESDSAVMIGQVLNGAVLQSGKPAVFVGLNGDDRSHCSEPTPSSDRT